MAQFVDQIHIHKRQGIVPPQFFGAHLRLYPKIFQRHIIRVYLGLMQSQIVLSRLQAMPNGKELFFYELAISFNNHQTSCSHMQWVVHLASHSANGKFIRIHMDLKMLVKLREFEHRRQDNLFLSSRKAWWQGSSHSWDTPFFNKSNKDLATLEKSQMKRR